MKISAGTLGFIALTALAAGTANATSFDEAVNGDLANSGLAPTALTLTAGGNVVTGAFGASPIPNQIDRDYFAITVPPGYRVSKMMLLSFQPGGSSSFFAVQAGAQVTMLPTSFDPSPLLGWAHVYTPLIGSDLLPAMNLNGGLDAGTYSFWLQDTDGSGVWPYSVDFRLEALPTPTPKKVPALELGALLSLAAGIIGVYRRRRAAV